LVTQIGNRDLLAIFCAIGFQIVAPSLTAWFVLTKMKSKPLVC